MPGRVIAEAYFPNGMSIRRRTGPGRYLTIIGGHATIVNEVDMAYVLRMPDANVRINEDHMDWYKKWVNMLGESRPVVAHVTNFDEPKPDEHISEGWEIPPAIGTHKPGCPCRTCDAGRAKLLREAATT